MIPFWKIENYIFFLNCDFCLIVNFIFSRKPLKTEWKQSLLKTVLLECLNFWLDCPTGSSFIVLTSKMVWLIVQCVYSKTEQCAVLANIIDFLENAHLSAIFIDGKMCISPKSLSYFSKPINDLETMVKDYEVLFAEKP